MLGGAVEPYPLPRNIIPALYVERRADLTTRLLDQLGVVAGARRRALVLAPLEEIDLFRVDSTGRDVERDWIEYTNAIDGFTYAGAYSTTDPAAYTRRLPVDLVVVAGERGPAARPMHPAWVRLLRDQCRTRPPFVFEGWGEWVPDADQPEDVARARVADPSAGELGLLCSACGTYLPRGSGWQGHRHFGDLKTLRWVFRAGAESGASLDGKEHVDLPAWL
jgi:hypothetical protein